MLIGDWLAQSLAYAGAAAGLAWVAISWLSHRRDKRTLNGNGTSKHGFQQGALTDSEVRRKELHDEFEASKGLFVAYNTKELNKTLVSILRDYSKAKGIGSTPIFRLEVFGTKAYWWLGSQWPSTAWPSLGDDVIAFVGVQAEKGDHGKPFLSGTISVYNRAAESTSLTNALRLALGRSVTVTLGEHPTGIHHLEDRSDFPFKDDQIKFREYTTLTAMTD